MLQDKNGVWCDLEDELKAAEVFKTSFPPIGVDTSIYEILVIEECIPEESKYTIKYKSDVLANTHTGD